MATLGDLWNDRLDSAYSCRSRHSDMAIIQSYDIPSKLPLDLDNLTVESASGNDNTSLVRWDLRSLVGSHKVRAPGRNEAGHFVRLVAEFY